MIYFRAKKYLNGRSREREYLTLDPSTFHPDAPGRLIRCSAGGTSAWAFVPSPLPPRLAWSGDLVRTLSEADRAIGELAGAGSRLPNPHLLIGPFKRREALLSSRIEGTQASLSDLLLFEIDPTRSRSDDDAREVLNYVRALDHGLAREASLPLSLRMLREMHGILLEDVRGEKRTPGEFRQAPNWIGPHGCTLDRARFVPPPPDEMQEALRGFESYLHEPSELPPLVRMALVHYQFEAIHPFNDGNGRIGRLLIALQLCRENLLPDPLLYLSAWFESHRQEYYDGLLAVSREGRWSEWISFFLRGVADQARDAIVRAGKLLALREEFRGRLQTARTSALALRLLDQLFELPGLTVPFAANLLDVTPRAAQQNVDKLVRAGILREVTGRKRGRIYLAEGIRSATEGPL